MCCRYDVNKSDIRYSEVKLSLSGDSTIKDSTNVEPSEPEYEVITTDHKLDSDVKMEANPAYHATS